MSQINSRVSDFNKYCVHCRQHTHTDTHTNGNLCLSKCFRNCRDVISRTIRIQSLLWENGSHLHLLKVCVFADGVYAELLSGETLNCALLII